MTKASDSQSSRKVNVGVVGLGFMGVTHLRAYQQSSRARIVAVCDAIRLPVNGVLPSVSGNVTSGAGDVRFDPDVKAFRNLEELLALPEVELVDLCTPTAVHPAQAIAALRAGKHVLCEKPLARTAAQAREILRVADASPGFLMPAMCMRFWPGWAWLKQVVEQQPYGRVLAMRFQRLSATPAWSQSTYAAGSDSGGALFDLHIHDTDFVQFLFGRPAAVFSSGVIRAGGTVDHVFTQYLYPNGPAIEAEGSWLLMQGFNMAYTLHCERATVDYDLARGADALRVTEAGQPARVVQSEGTDGYRAEIEYMLDCVLNGRPPGIVTARDGVSALEICEAEEQSVRTGRVVTL